MYEPAREAANLAIVLRQRAGALLSERRLQVPSAEREVLGLRKAEIHGAVSEWVAATAGIEDPSVFETCQHLWAGPTREEQLVSTRILARRREALANQPWEKIRPWLDEVDSVEGADAAAIYIFGPWASFDLAGRLDPLRSLLRPNDIVGRRVALVATTTLRSQSDYADAAQEFVDATAADREPLIVDAVIWALCALSRFHRDLVERYLERSTDLDQIAREQVQNWLDTGSRARLDDRDWRIPRPNARGNK